VSKKALGRGISALLPDDDFSPPRAVDSEEVQQIVLEKLSPNPDQPRKTFDEEAIEELSESIKTRGVIQPLLVEKKGKGYVIIVGERRFRAAQKAGLSAVPVIVREFSNEERLEVGIIENIQREDLNPLEEAEAYQKLIQEIGISQEEVAVKVGKKRSTITNSLRLLKLPEEIKTGIRNNEISAGHARAILSVVNPADQEILFHRIVEKGLSVREAEKTSQDFNKGKRLKSGKKGEAAQKKIPELQAMESRFIECLGTKVSLKGTLEKGKLIIDYFSSEDLERLYNLFDQGK